MIQRLVLKRDLTIFECETTDDATSVDLEVCIPELSAFTYFIAGLNKNDKNEILNDLQYITDLRKKLHHQKVPLKSEDLQKFIKSEFQSIATKFSLHYVER